MAEHDWSPTEWEDLEVEIRGDLKACKTDSHARRVITRHARHVMRHYTTGFFIVSRFLPKNKRDDVELIYAAVRYPDEVVDTFEISDEKKRDRLTHWRSAYADAMQSESLCTDPGTAPPPLHRSICGSGKKA